MASRKQVVWNVHSRDGSTEIEAGVSSTSRLSWRILKIFFFFLWHIQVEYKNYFCD